MDLRKVNDWLQLLASVGVVSGLVLVAVELQQNQQLARAQLNSDGSAAFQQLRASKQQEPVARALAVATETPAALTAADQMIRDGYYMEVYELVMREWILIRRGIYEDNLDIYIFNFGAEVLGTKYGLAWWQVMKASRPVPDAIASRIASYIESGELRQTAEKLSAIESILNADSGTQYGTEEAQ